MAIPIPPSAPDLHLPLTQRQDAAPVQPVSAVPGVAENVQSLDSRVALRWVQPSLAGTETQATRPSVQSPGAYFTPGGSDPDAATDRPVHPMLAQGLAMWLSRLLAPTSDAAPPRWPSPDAAQVSGLALPATPWGEAGTPREALVNERLQLIYRALAQSPAFAAQKLAQLVLPHPAGAARDGTATPAQNEKVLEGWRRLAAEPQDPSAAQVSAWVAALEPDSEAAQQAARWLTQGQLLLQTELAPGVPLRLWREDAWREQAGHPGQLEKGASLQVDVDLPHLGPLRVVASQWGGEIVLRLWHSPQAQQPWQAMGPRLQALLQAQGVTDVQWGMLPAVKEGDG